mmetsp:Transcript_24343/g.52177  ORF Transcript_24343/g.52177 Transcript_24343/m.52177 type:complete len:103 (-) Transcript_24343:33-341(-)
MSPDGLSRKPRRSLLRYLTSDSTAARAGFRTNTLDDDRMFDPPGNGLVSEIIISQVLTELIIGTKKKRGKKGRERVRARRARLTVRFLTSLSRDSQINNTRC